ncbi:MAG TPA: hypothetical protein VM030_06125 [Acidimicrobiales bacterium]|nr:hypothetical protein [Acidimicrobiales bacterium]
MSFFVPVEDGWPYPDTGPEQADLSAETDDDLLSMICSHGHLLDRLDPMEREVVAGSFGLDGRNVRSVDQLEHDLGCRRADVQEALGSGLAKLRHDLMA